MPVYCHGERNRLHTGVWVSEIMLQQTRVEAVKPYFERFTTALPDAKALAVCPEDELLKLWEGLGYYNRVRNMQKAAVEVVENYGGQLPADYEKLLKLRGSAIIQRERSHLSHTESRFRRSMEMCSVF